jgi:hypothetical protein
VKIIFSLLLVFGLNAAGNNKRENIEPALECTKRWFNAWELVSKEVFKLKVTAATRFVFFDSVFVYTTSPLTGQGGKIITGPQLLNHKQVWYKKAHNGNLILPDSANIPVRMMIYASPTIEKKVKAFFIMPLLSFWEMQKVDAHGIGLEKLTAGVFAHEFCHTQQLASFDKFGVYFEAYQKKFGVENFGDDMMQNMYENDSVITDLYKKELEIYTTAPILNTTDYCKAIASAQQQFNKKHQAIFNKDTKQLKRLDDIWLTMEGIGQYAMYAYFTHVKGAGLAEDKAFIALKTRWWSQEQGFAMFYLLSKMKNPQTWAKYFFGANMKTIMEMLKAQCSAKMVVNK